LTGTEKNDAGIVGIQLFIRGKPWTITIDDYMLFDTSSSSPTLEYAQQSSGNAMWAPILEKAWAKIKGNYAQADAGFVVSGLRALTGAPTFTYSISDVGSSSGYSISETFDLIAAGESVDYIMGASTAGSSDSVFNDCGIAAGHAYSIITSFEMTDSSSTVHKMLLLRNPWGVT
jgi:calpain-15